MNRSETVFRRWAESEGWHVTKRGWPDFICRRVRDGQPEIMCVEVKYADGLSAEQRETATDLAVHGIPSYVWYDQSRELEPLSAATRLLDDEQVDQREAIDRLGRELRQAQARADAATRSAQTAQERNRELRAERQQERASLAQIVDDLGYLLRRVQDYQGALSDSGPSYTSRVKALIRRYPDLAYQELPAAGRELAERCPA